MWVVLPVDVFFNVFVGEGEHVLFHFFYLAFPPDFWNFNDMSINLLGVWNGKAVVTWLLFCKEMSINCNEVLFRGRQNLIMVGFNTEKVYPLSIGTFYFFWYFHFYFFQGIREKRKFPSVPLEPSLFFSLIFRYEIQWKFLFSFFLQFLIWCHNVLIFFIVK